MFINDLPISITDSKFRHIRTPPGKQPLQHDLDNLLSWSTSSNLHFNSSKSCHLSFDRKFLTSYTISGSIIITKQSRKDLGVTLSDNPKWKTHHDIYYFK